MKNFKKIITQHFSEHEKVQKRTLVSLDKKILLFSNKISTTLKNKKKVFWCGNGGSATDSMHISSELVGRYVNDRKSLRSICLSSDIANATCISNDYGYEKIFARQLEGLGESKDVLVCLSTSGNSKNIISVIKKAKQMGIYTISLLGKNGGKVKNLSNLELIIPSNTTARIQEMHLFIGHIVCDLIEEKLNLK